MTADDFLLLGAPVSARVHRDLRRCTNQRLYSLICIFIVGKPSGCPLLISHLKQHNLFFAPPPLLMKHVQPQSSPGYCLFNFFIIMRLSCPHVYTQQKPVDELLICSERAGGKVNHNIHPHCNTGGIIQASLPLIMSFSLQSVPLFMPLCCYGF